MMIHHNMIGMDDTHAIISGTRLRIDLRHSRKLSQVRHHLAAFPFRGQAIEHHMVFSARHQPAIDKLARDIPGFPQKGRQSLARSQSVGVGVIMRQDKYWTVPCSCAQLFQLILVNGVHDRVHWVPLSTKDFDIEIGFLLCTSRHTEPGSTTSATFHERI
jgi:hypothetical protein